MAKLISFHLCSKRKPLFTRLQKTKILTQFLMTATLLSVPAQTARNATPLPTFCFRSDINDKRKQ
jgi:hypothetical protein